MTVYGSKISYFTGKLESYLRFRRVPYKLLPTTAGNPNTLRENAGTAQMPVVRLSDDRWMTDSTPMIAWLDAQCGGPSIYPTDPILRFVGLLIEDYADEWLWRAAMHYRWTYRADRQYASHSLYDELMAGYLPIPRIVGVNYLKLRQLRGFVIGDGVSRETRAHADETYLTTLDHLQTIFKKRRFLLGDRPTIADFGMMGPMLRHFSQDPTPAEIMRTRAPGVYEWVAGMWNLPPDAGYGTLVAGVDDLLERLLTEICETHLAQLRQNAEAFGTPKKRYDQTIQGCPYRQVPVSRYRVWCLETLRRAWSALSEGDQSQLKEHLTSPEASTLWDDVAFKPSDYDTDNQAPFNRAINVFGTGIPGS
ncbi:MAG: glutathione S-transferase C-terminal domain-containing protein [Pseudomonadota bacterium]